MDTNKKKQFAIKVSVVTNAVLVILKLIVGIITGSVGIISEAIHSGIDLTASIVAFFSIKHASVPADEKHQYGHGKFEDISGLSESVLILLAAGIIFYEAVTKLLSHHSSELKLDLGIGLMLISTIAYTIVSQYLFKVAKETDSVALAADAKHLQTDIITSFGVFVALILIKISGWEWIDPVMAIAIALLITYMAYNIATKSIHNLIDICLPKEEENKIKEIVNKYSEEIISVHNFRSRKSGETRYVDFHMIVNENLTVKQGHLLCDLLEEDIKKLFPDINVLIHIEPCQDNCDECSVKTQNPQICKKY